MTSALAAAGLLASAGCGKAVSSGTPSGSCPTAAELVERGPSTFTYRDFDFVDASRATPAQGSYAGATTRTLKTRVWIPDGPGPFPLILHSHGLADSRLGEIWLTEHLASWGFAVAAPDFPLSSGTSPAGPSPFDVQNQPDDLAFVRDQLLSGELGPRLDPSRVGLSGLSLGGMTTMLATYHATLRLSGVQAAFTMAPLGCVFGESFFTTATVPLAIVHGDDDILLPYAEHALRTFERAHQPGFLATLSHGTHVGFTSIGVALDPTMHYDRFGCSFVPAGAPQFPALGGPEVGITTGECPVSCGTMGADPPLDAKIQQEVTAGLAASFFARHLSAGQACDSLSALAAAYPALALTVAP